MFCYRYIVRYILRDIIYHHLHTYIHTIPSDETQNAPRHLPPTRYRAPATTPTIINNERTLLRHRRRAGLAKQIHPVQHDGRGGRGPLDMLRARRSVYEQRVVSGRQ